MSFHLSAGWIAASFAAIVFALFYPLALAFIAWKRLHVSWRYFGFGALVFFVFQVITRVPLVVVLGRVLAAQLDTIAVSQPHRRSAPLLRDRWHTPSRKTILVS